MATYTRKNAWNNGGTFNNKDLHWFAIGVREMQSRSLNDETSWWFFAGIHGYNTGNWTNITSPPAVPNSPLPSTTIRKKYWNQCQHGTWFFLPWHRGYLYALENVLREIIVKHGGPDDWALPYWNYFGPKNEYRMPPAFAFRTMPDGTPNPLFVGDRYGHQNNGNIFIPLASGFINENCQQNMSFVGNAPDEYGGEKTGFSHGGSPDRGSLEANPHNFVHGIIGGQNPMTKSGGLMGNPRTAALDPIFYLHHCNIDRMWAEWNAAGNSNPVLNDWLKGPTVTGDRKFYMPKPNKSSWFFTPEMVTTTLQLDYKYEQINPITKHALLSKKASRLRRIGLPLNEAKSLSSMKEKSNDELVGASDTSISVGADGTRAEVKLEKKGWNKTKDNFKKFRFMESFTEFSEKDAPDEMYLLLEGIRGQEDSIICTVSVNQKYVGHISLFGLQSASDKDEDHGGGGLTIKLDITKVVDELQLTDQENVENLDVRIEPINLVAEGSELSIDRIGIYRKPAK